MLGIREFTVVKNLMSVVNVEKLSGAAQSSLGIGEFTLEKNLMNVNVGKPSLGVRPLCSIRKFTLEIKAMNVLNVVRLLIETLSLLNIKEFILERSRINVPNVENPSIRAQP